MYIVIVEVCEHPGNATRAIVAPEKPDFLERRSDPKDRRTFCVYPTQKAPDLCPEIIRLRQQPSPRPT